MTTAAGVFNVRGTDLGEWVGGLGGGLTPPPAPAGEGDDVPPVRAERRVLGPETRRCRVGAQPQQRRATGHQEGWRPVVPVDDLHRIGEGGGGGGGADVEV